LQTPPPSSSRPEAMKDPERAAPPSPVLAMSSSSTGSAPTSTSVAAPQALGTTATTTSWHTDNLGLRLGSDVLSAASAGVLIAPIISIIDNYVLPPSSPEDLAGS